MDYVDLKNKLTGMFDAGKLQAAPGEWGFFNETRREVRTVGYATNLTGEIIQRAGEAKVDFLLTHHDSWEFIFGLKESCNRLLEELGIAHAFFHAPLDDAGFGTSSSLAAALGVKNCQKVMPYAEVFFGGVAGDVEPAGFDRFAGKLEQILGENIRCYQNHEGPVRRVAVAAGGGNMTNEMRIAVENGCDTYVTGEYVLYSQQYAQHVGMNLLVGSHTNTEILGVEAMAQRLARGTGLKLVRISEPNY